MANLSISTELRGNTYPGRGIVVGKTPDGSRIGIAYFTMGRSVNSRNRVFIEAGEGIQNEAFDPSKMVDPSLIIYAPVRVLGTQTIVTNGDQTDTIYNAIQAGNCFEDALSTRTFEPDPPNFTPRISAIIDRKEGIFTYKLSILKSIDGNPEGVLRSYFHYEEPIAGTGHFIHTYQCDGSPIPSFTGEPKAVDICNDFSAFSEEIWQSLNSENKVSLFTRFIHIQTGDTESRIYNKLQT